MGFFPRGNHLKKKKKVKKKETKILLYEFYIEIEVVKEKKKDCFGEGEKNLKRKSYFLCVLHTTQCTPQKFTNSYLN